MAKHEAKKADAKASLHIAPTPTKHKVAKGIAAGVVALAAYGFVYASGASYFSTHFIPGTTVNGKNVSWLTEQEVAELIDQDTESYQNEVKVGGLSFTVQASDIGFSSDGEACAHEAMQQNDPTRWALGLINPHDVSVETGIVFDEKALDETVSKAVDNYNKQAKDPQDAEVAYDDDSVSFVVVAAKDGTKLNKDAVISAVRTSVATQRDETTVEDDKVLVQPSRKSNDAELNEAVDSANHILDLSIPVVVGEDEQTRVSRDQIAQWVELGDDLEVEVDEEAIVEWAQDNLADGARRSDDDYDYTLDADATAAALLQNLEDGSSEAIEVEVTATKKKEPEKEQQQDSPSGSWNSSLGRYIDVDLANQYARLYDASGNVIWESSVVSGDTGEGLGTPTGTYHVYAKETNRDLVGLDYNNDGLPDYSSHVNYWMPFSGGYGLHDATWRDSFGGSIYSYAGSHGCVNLPYDAAASLYSTISVGETVVLHW